MTKSGSCLAYSSGTTVRREWYETRSSESGVEIEMSPRVGDGMVGGRRDVSVHEGLIRCCWKG